MTSSRTGPVDWHTAVQATLHCLTGCAIGEVLGMVIGTGLGWANGPTVALAFAFGYALTMRPLLRSGLAVAAAIKLAWLRTPSPSPSWSWSTT